MRGIYKRGRIFWIRYVGPDGKIVFESSGSENEREAESLLYKRKAQVIDGNHPKSKEPVPSEPSKVETSNSEIYIDIKPDVNKYSFKDLANDYLKWAERQRSYKTKKSMINHMVTYFGDKPSPAKLAIRIYRLIIYRSLSV